MKKLIIITLFLLSACALGPDYKSPELSLPASFSNTPESINVVDVTDSKGADQPNTQETETPINYWWKSFDDATLQNILTTVDGENLNFKQQQSRIDQARSLRTQSILDFFPVIQSQAAYTDSRTSAGRFPGASPSFRQYKLYSVGATASWELDLFGSVRRRYEANDALLAAATSGLEDLKRLTMLESAKSYFNIIASKAKLDVLKDNVKNQEETLKLTKAMLTYGTASDFDTARSEMQVARTRALVPQTESLLENSLQQLGVFLGKGKTAVPDLKDINLSSLLNTFNTISLTNPDTIIRNRPDVKIAENELIAANAKIGVAAADLFPKLTVDGSFSLEAPHISDFNQTPNQGRTFGPKLSWDFLDIGRGFSKRESVNAQHEEKLNGFKQKVLEALASIENSLMQFRTSKEALESLKVASEASKRAEKVADERYKIGASDFLSVLDAQRERLKSETDLIDGQLSFLESVINVLAETWVKK